MILAILGLATLTACNTVEGVGTDISASARTVSSWFGGPR
jgi:predicted small secreted protein